MIVILQSNKKFSPQTNLVRYQDYTTIETAANFIKDAKEKSKQILQQANKQANFMNDEAKKFYETEKERGYKEGLALAQQKQIEVMLNMLSGGVDYIASLENIILKTINEVIKKVLGEYLPDERLSLLIKNVIKNLNGGKFIKISVAPEQLSQLTLKKEEIAAVQPAFERIDIIQDNNLKPDQCFLETETGIIDISLESQVSILLKVIEKIIK